MSRWIPLILVALSLVPDVRARAPDQPFYGVGLGSPVAEARRRLEPHCGELRAVTPERAILPVAEAGEIHLVCLRFTFLEGLSIAEVAFTFGDGVLTMIEARGGATAALIPDVGARTGSFAGYELYEDRRWLSRVSEDVVWVLSPEAMHANLFVWSNPALPSSLDAPGSFEPSAARPAILDFGASIDEISPRIEEACQKVQRDEVAHPWLPTRPRRQTQINCYGHVFAGFPRKIEAVFGDGRLELAWILTARGEENRLRRALVAAHGPVEFVSDQYDVFDGGRVALRKDKPEVLMLSDDLLPLYRARYGWPRPGS